MKEHLYPAYFRNYVSTFLFVQTLTCMFATPLVLTATWGIWAHTLIGYLIVLGVTVVPCVLIAVSHTRYTQRKNGFVVFENGVIQCFLYNKKKAMRRAIRFL